MSRDEIIAIGKRIKEARNSLRYSQREMAKVIGISNSYLSAIEIGSKKPGAEIILKLADKFKINTEYLYHGTGDMFSNAARAAYLKEFNFEDDLDSTEKLLWLMENSLLFKNTVMGFAQKYFLDNEEIIKENISRSKRKKEDKEDAN